VRCDNAERVAAGGGAAANAGWRVLEDEAALGSHAAARGAQQVRIGPARAAAQRRGARAARAPGAHAGLPCATSSAATNTSGSGTRVIASAAVAYARVADVQIAQRGRGRWRAGASCGGAAGSAARRWDRGRAADLVEEGLHAGEHDDPLLAVLGRAVDDGLLEADGFALRGALSLNPP
jgi:hypothetical protein